MKNLVEAWITLYMDKGNSRTDAARYLSREFECNYSLNRLNEWARGKRMVPDHVQRLMRRAVARNLFPDVKPSQIAQLEPPVAA